MYIENDAEIIPEHYTWKVAEKGFKMAFMMQYNLQWLILVKFFMKNKKYCEIKVRPILVWALYSINYGILYAQWKSSKPSSKVTFTLYLTLALSISTLQSLWKKANKEC